eukprot:11468-Heterococcus_DN1.PRE.2
MHKRRNLQQSCVRSVASHKSELAKSKTRHALRPNLRLQSLPAALKQVHNKVIACCTGTTAPAVIADTC